MMLGSKGILPPMIHGLLRISCSRNPENIRNPPCSGYFLMFYGSQSHAFSCKHETHNLLTLVSFHVIHNNVTPDESPQVPDKVPHIAGQPPHFEVPEAFGITVLIPAAPG